MRQLEFEVIVFTDLDGTLLDETCELHSPAYVLNELYRRGVLTVLASSKTKAELDAFKSLLQYDAPLISENGAGISWPKSVHPVLESVAGSREVNASYDFILKALAMLRNEYGYLFAGFADMTLDDVCEATGLDGPGAQLAMQRLASEPIEWGDSLEDFAEFKRHLYAIGLTLVQSGGFDHVMSPTNKGQAAIRVLAALTAQRHNKSCVIACGVSPNDLSMLNMADACVVFPRPDGSYLDIGWRSGIRAKAAGALPWLEAVNQLTRYQPSTSTIAVEN